jgi:virginiamycin A acetyltransferase
MVFKTAVSWIAVSCVAPLGISECAARYLLRRDVWFASHSEFLSLMPGKFGRYLRNAYYWMTLKECPLDCCFIFGVAFTHSEATVGHRIYVGANSRIGIASIGDDTLIGDHVHLLSGKQQHSFQNPELLVQEQPQIFRRIHVGGNCWVGTNSVVMADIGKNCVIGAGSVVTDAIPANSVAAGSPARVIRPTQNSDEILEEAAERG